MINIIVPFLSVSIMMIAILTNAWSADDNLSWGLWEECWGISIKQTHIGGCVDIRVPEDKKPALLACRILALASVILIFLGGIYSCFTDQYIAIPITLYGIATVCAIACLIVWRAKMVYKVGIGYSYILYIVGTVLGFLSIGPTFFRQ